MSLPVFLIPPLYFIPVILDRLSHTRSFSVTELNVNVSHLAYLLGNCLNRSCMNLSGWQDAIIIKLKLRKCVV